MAGNELAWRFYLEMRGLIFNGMGGLDAASIEAGFRQFEIPPGLRRLVFSKLLLLAEEILGAEDHGG